MWRIEVSYAGRYYPCMDEIIEKIAKRESDGSGMGLGERDLSFYFKTKKQAEKFASDLDKFVKMMNFEITIGEIERLKNDN